ncbi:AI-2E family transporter [Flavisolibacter nicotianae]|uniref:AI-2E family transporter n=1 Tax=Flavisolibacter nicotianae TaxID=2364882 RepID=UPI000EB515D9|nr:AI-2E family transporter [Flavisolibacter nicotianae]
MTETEKENEYPFYIKLPAILIGLIAAVYILFVLGDILIPLAFAALIAILLNPLYARFETIMPKVPAILLTLLIACLVIAGLFYFLSTQISVFLERLPLIKQKLTLLLMQLQHWTKNELGFSIQKQVTALTSSLNNGGGDMLKNTVGPVLAFTSVVLLIPTYVFLMLYYKPLILDFLFQIFSEKHSLRVAEILSETKGAVQSYMQGLMIETVIVCVLNAVALLLIGVPSAIVIGVIGGILNLIPYIGGLIAIALPVLMVTITQNGFSGQLAVIGAYLVIQFFDNNILMPRVVSSKVQVNALLSIVGVLLGGALWGVSGMFLSIPLIGVLKIVFDRIDELKPWGSLLGTEVPSEHIGLVWQKRWDRIFRRMQKKKEIEEKLAEEAEVQQAENNDEQAISKEQ